MEPTFGVKQEHLHYAMRKGCYAVILDPPLERVAVVYTTRGHLFLPGGGIEEGETEEQCLKREVLEETGYEVKIVSFIGRAQRYFFTSRNETLLSAASFYAAQLVNKVTEPIENDHLMKWIDMGRAEELFHEHHVWAVKRWLELKPQ